MIVNADALQVYDGWRILTARPSPEEEASVPHALFGHVAMEQPYSVGHWLREAAAFVDAPQRPIFVGGTGLYFTALTQGLAEIPPIPPRHPGRSGCPAARQVAGRSRCAHARRTGPAQPGARPARLGGAARHGPRAGRLAGGDAPPLLPLSRATALVLRPAVPWLDARIAARFDAMLEQGALAEVQALLPRWRENAPAFRALGAAPLRAHLEGRLSLREARDAAVQASRLYAKRQRTWFRNRMTGWASIPLP
ncbi:tRNA delta(2)-isopentenylpyrophosphate transferase [Rubellimicrobium thermophilum DSM 16684]|uniref:tRNA delta(2)-isopentenylpyrophosphate transferase n=1 Tax=Rubellimicrobium thermophilum DSM 16684 TaxID=1123069 RepID=S9R2C0_9RHOB|nr:tRNA delta(2)-isopentenylpyrophosphate transferase [Rubellimicrobium thermophilum DSM 16684]